MCVYRGKCRVGRIVSSKNSSGANWESHRSWLSLAELRRSPTGWGVVGKQRGKAFFLLGGTGAKTVWHPSLARDLRVMSDAGLPTPCQRGFL